jgi:hypothetical protein
MEARVPQDMENKLLQFKQCCERLREIDQSLKVTNATLVKVPFDLEHWTAVAAEKYPHGLPKPYT